MGSPVPILASHLQAEGITFADKWQNYDDTNRIHINVDDAESVGPMLEVYIAQMFAHTKLLDRLTDIQAKFKATFKSQKSKNDRPNMAFLYSMQAIQVIRFTIAEIFTENLRLDIVRETDDLDLLKAEMIRKSKLQDKKHKRLLDSQLFSYYVERCLDNS